jgi:hypothetical protein
MVAQTLNLSTAMTEVPSGQAGNRAGVKDAQNLCHALFQNDIATVRSLEGEAALHHGAVRLLGMKFKL